LDQLLALLLLDARRAPARGGCRVAEPPLAVGEGGGRLIEVARRLAVLLEAEVRLADAVPRARIAGLERLRLDEVLEARHRPPQGVEVESPAPREQVVARRRVGALVLGALERAVERLERAARVVGVEEAAGAPLVRLDAARQGGEPDRGDHQ